MILFMRDFWIETDEDSWKDLAVKGKEQDFLTEWERNFAYNMGDLVRYGKRPSDKQCPFAERLWNIYQQHLADERRKQK